MRQAGLHVDLDVGLNVDTTTDTFHKLSQLMERLFNLIFANINNCY